VVLKGQLIEAWVCYNSWAYNKQGSFSYVFRFRGMITKMHTATTRGEGVTFVVTLAVSS